MYGSIEDPAGADTVPSDARPGAPSWAKKVAVALACFAVSATVGKVARTYAGGVGPPTDLSSLVDDPTWMPLGNYASSCQGCAITGPGDPLTGNDDDVELKCASCDTADDDDYSRNYNPSIKLAECPGGNPITNSNGNLVWQTDSSYKPIAGTAGNYAASCVCCTFYDEQLSCLCNAADGTQKRSSIYVLGCADDEITNNNGVLNCQSGHVGLYGSYGSSCSGCEVTGGTLTCTACEAADGSTKASSRELSDCTSFWAPGHVQPPNVVNNDGSLDCAISGSFSQTCSGCSTSEPLGCCGVPPGIELTCTCQAEHGGPAWTSTVGHLSTCAVGTIQNTNGQLSCYSPDDESTSHSAPGLPGLGGIPTL